MNNFEKAAQQLDLNWNTSIERMVFNEMKETREAGRELLRVTEALSKLHEEKVSR